MSFITIKHTLLLLIFVFLSSAPLILHAEDTGKTTSPDTVHTPVEKGTILSENNLFQITDVLKDGKVVIDGLKGPWQIHDKRFSSMNEERYNSTREFLLGKFIMIPFPTINTGITLPAELYNPLCFSSDPEKQKLTDQCPVILQE
ncbi:MAG: hypothetical protein HQM16_00835 [Deltaproteobacteria bacterium]|nr:hypothetical protein [Deltaproteobacteria bacterium]